MFKSIKSIFKSKESDYWDNDDYSQNTNDSSNWEDEPDDSPKETRLGNMLLFICIIAIYLLWLLPKSEILKTLYEHGYWYVIAIYMALSATLIVPISYLLHLAIGVFFLMASDVQTTITILKGMWKTLIRILLYGFLLFVVIGNPFDNPLDFVVKEINHTEMTPSDTIITVITDRYDGTRAMSISFKDGDKTKRIELSHSPIGKYNIGDPIKVVYGKGCLGITDIMDWEVIKYDNDTMEEDLANSNKSIEYEPDIERFGEYLKARVPKVGKNYEGWTDASFTIDKDGNVSNVKITTHSKVGKAIHKALTDMGKWVGDHKAG